MWQGSRCIWERARTKSNSQAEPISWWALTEQAKVLNHGECLVLERTARQKVVQDPRLWLQVKQDLHATVEMDDFQPQLSPFGEQMLSFRVFLLLKLHVLASETLSPTDYWSKARFLDKFSRTFITSILKKAGGSSEMKVHTSSTGCNVIISAVFLGNRPRQSALCDEATKGMAWFV